MDAKVTLSFDKEVIEKAKKYAESQNISLSRLTEFLLRQITTGNYKALEEFPVSEWVNQLAEGSGKYLTRKRTGKSLRNEYYNSRK
jgi:hypothetical protein